MLIARLARLPRVARVLNASIAVAAVALRVVAQIKLRSDRKRAAPALGPVATPCAMHGLHPAGHVAVWAIPLVVLASTAFWWLPGIWLASTKGPSDFAFAHPEGVLQRLAPDRQHARHPSNAF